MCLIAFALDAHPRYALVLVANRDEYRQRPTDPADFWTDAPQVLAGRDQQAGGTWIGITTTGQMAAVTNYRDPRQQVVAARSRGRLVADYLCDTADNATTRLQALLQRDGQQYDGFNLLYGSWRKLQYFTNRGGSSGPVQPGVHALSNHLLDSRWPKMLRARQLLTAALQQDELTSDELLLLLRDPTPFADAQLPDTGIGLERERLLSPLFIAGSTYGTRSTTVILVSRNGEVLFAEQGYDQPDQAPRLFNFSIAP